MMTAIIVHRSFTVAVLLLVIFGNIVISQQSVVQQPQQKAAITSTAAATTSITITSNSTSSSSSSASIKNLTPPSTTTTTHNATIGTTTTKTTTNKTTLINNKNKNENTSSEISIKAVSVHDADSDVDVDAAADDAISRVVVVGGGYASGVPANSTQFLSTFEDVVPSSITPTTYRPLRPSIAPQTSAQDRERKLMNVLAARRTALHRGSYRTRIGTTGRTASASIETTPKTPTDPRSICIRNCTKNFTRRTTASCMRQCASFHRNAATANGTTIVVKSSSKSGLGTQQRERDTNEILFTDESSHGLFVVAKELNDTANHITEGVGTKSSGGYKFKARKKPATALVVVTVAPPTSFEEDDIAPYLYFGQKLPPIRPAMLAITAVNNDHPKLLEVSVVSSTPATVSSTLSSVERSRSRYKYNMRDRGNLPFNRRFTAAGQAERRRNAMSSMGGENSTPIKQGGATTSERPMAVTAPTTMTTPVMQESKQVSAEIKNVPIVRRADDVVEEPQQPKLVPNLAAVKVVPSASTPLIITVLSDEEGGVTEMPQIDKLERDQTRSTAPSTTIRTTQKSAKIETALTSSRSPDGISTTKTPTTSTSKPPGRSTTTMRMTTKTTTTTRVPSPLPTISPPSPAPSQAKSSSSLSTSNVPLPSPSPPTLLESSPAPSLSSSPPSSTITRTNSFTSTTPVTSMTLPKSIIEEDTERLRALGPSLTQEINTDDRTNLIIFINRTSGPYVPHSDNQNNNNNENNENDNDNDGFLNSQPTRIPSHFHPDTDAPPTILHTTVLTSIRSTVNPRTTTPRAASESPASSAIPLKPTCGSTSAVGGGISSTVMTDEREVAMELRRINMATYVLVGIGVLPLIAVIAYVMRNFIIRRSIKTDEVFDVCITDQQPISPVKKLDSKYHHDDEDDEDDVDHHHHHHHYQQQQKQQQQIQQHHHHQHHRVQHPPIYRQHSIPQQNQPQQRDSNYNINIHCSSSMNNNSGRYDEQCSVTSDQEFDRNNIRLKSLLGEGNFGQVWKAEADDLSGHFGATRIVAVKTVRVGSTQVGLKEEASIMRKLGSHQNVVTLLGACVESEPHMLIMEYAMRGRLLSLLRAARNATNILPASVPGGRSLTPLSPRTLTGFALDIACGMEYIAERRIVHRDLAARNVLLDHNGICKICDFGMSLDLDAEREAKTLQKKLKQKEEEAKTCANEIMRSNSNKFKFDFGGRFIINNWSPNIGGNSNNTNTKASNNQQQHKECNEKKSPRHANHDTISRRPALPIRWMAPEALQYHVFTTETDIWAFGIVLWEIATLGSTPYSHLTGREVIRRVPNGLRPDIPKEGRHEFYNLMARCWHKEPQMRPSFTQARLEITRSLGKWVEDDSATSDYMDVSGFSEDMEHGMVYFNHRISEFECEI